METWNLSLPEWANSLEKQELKAVPCFSQNDLPVPCFLEPLPSEEKEPVESDSRYGTVPEWVSVVFTWTEKETIRAYRKIEVIHDRQGEEAAQKWIIENSRNFLDNSIDV